MSQPAGNCSSCGAPVQFRWSGAVQTACPYCHSILVRTDVDLKNVGKIADLPPDPSPISLLTEGTFKNRSFQVIGRLHYQWTGGSWNEWHLLFSDGASGWLSDAQLQYAVSFLDQPDTTLPQAGSQSPGNRLTFHGVEYQVSTITTAWYKGFEGELPFPFYDKRQMEFVDLRTPGREFGTIDYSGDEPLLFLGEWVSFEELQLKNLREFEGWAAA
jgi:hypothetical protein